MYRTRVPSERAIADSTPTCSATWSRNTSWSTSRATRPKFSRSRYDTCAPTTTPLRAAPAQTARMVCGVPAWKPQATFAEVTTRRRPASSVTSSPRSALRSTTRGPSAAMRKVEGEVVVGDAVPDLVVQRAGTGVVGEDVEAEDRVAEVAA